MTDKQAVAMTQPIESKIFLVRGRQVMLGTHLAELYEVEPEALDRAVERNLEYFPEDSVFRLSHDELAGLGADRHTAYAFTGPGMAMLASILLDDQAARGMQDACAPTCSCRN